MIPYDRVLAIVKEVAMAGIAFEMATIEGLASIMNVEPKVISGWR